MKTAITRRRLLSRLSTCVAASTGAPWLVTAGSASAATGDTKAAAEAPPEADFLVIPTRVYPAPDAPDGYFPVKYRKLLPATAPRARYPGFRPGRWVLKAGTVRREGARPLPVDIVFERDVAMTLRDGTTIYTDIFRPVGDARVPAIFSWSPYGKALGGQWLDDLPNRSGVPLARVSELQRFEGADPAYWCAQGYAVINPDPRGALRSQGHVNYWGRQLAEDGYDFIEWTAAQPWCSGAVVMSGNSWLAVTQWFIAAERPPHLVAIAPWEGLMDQGPAPGIPAGIVFGEIIIQSLAGSGYIEDQPRMALEYPLMNAFWQDHRARVERIQVLAYVVASYTNAAHTTGTFDAWRHLGSDEKWLRIHNTQEWTDYYEPAHVEDLRRFFDRYAKGVDNGWSTTPKVRMAVLDPGGTDIVDRVETAFPPARAQRKVLYLSAADRMSAAPSPTEQSVRYDATDGRVSFVFNFDRDTEVSGYMVLRLWLEAEGSDDMDITVSARKRPGLAQRLREKLPGPPAGSAASGLLRVSCRELDAQRSSASNPVLAMRRELRLAAGEIVPVDIALSPMALYFHAGDAMEVTVASFRYPPFIPLKFGEALVPSPADGLTFEPGHPGPLRQFGGPKEPSATRLAVTNPATRNKGRHIIHLGGRYDSRLSYDEVPPAAAGEPQKAPAAAR